jgi:hypothetical protein
MENREAKRHGSSSQDVQRVQCGFDSRPCFNNSNLNVNNTI